MQIPVYISLESGNIFPINKGLPALYMSSLTIINSRKYIFKKKIINRGKYYSTTPLINERSYGIFFLRVCKKNSTTLHIFS